MMLVLVRMVVLDLAQLQAKARTWILSDPDARDRAELEKICASNDAQAAAAALHERFSGRLEFGTAGLRGVLGAGESRMNLAVILTTTDGLARAWKAMGTDRLKRGVVIGYDGRHRSQIFAHAAAEVFLAHDFTVHLFETLGSTPLTAFALKELGAAGAVMVTASHNPPEYNGYKVYSANGAQIVPPEDGAIAKAIDEAPAANQVPRLSLAEGLRSRKLQHLGHAMEAAYLAGVANLLKTKGAVDSSALQSARKALRIVYTPLHGVGAHLAEIALAKAGFANVHTVPEQREPDPDFSTVAFPNPEERGAMDLALRDAKSEKADLVLANDPDADRLAVMVPGKANASYVQLTGNQVGVLLGHAIMIREQKHEASCVLASCVSSPMMGAIAKSLGIHYEETLTGFKWIANRAMELEHESGKVFLFGYEEALGYTAGTLVRDKDGISAAVLFADLTASLKAAGKTVLEHWDEIVRTYGLYASSQVSVTKKGPEGSALLSAMMNTVRNNPLRTLGGRKLLTLQDLQENTEQDFVSGQTRALTGPKSNVLIFQYENGLRVIARPSGTEPKAKFYFDLRESVAAGEAVSDAEARAQAALRICEAEFKSAAGVE
jgi:phosphomannomutase